MFSYLYSTAALLLTQIHEGILAFFKERGRKKKAPTAPCLKGTYFRRGFSAENCKSNVAPSRYLESGL